MIHDSSVIVPSLYIQKRGEESVKLVLRLTTAKRKFVVRLTGGCGFMQPDESRYLFETFLTALNGFCGAMLFGGTRMVLKNDPSRIVPAITEVPPMLRGSCPDAVILGVVPRTGDFRIDPRYGLIVSNEPGNDYVTIVHPEQDICLLVQQSVDEGVKWEAEFEECLKIMGNLRTFAGWKTLTVCYNGGSVTEKEILATAALGWPLLLVRGSGRITERYAADRDFLAKHENVQVCDNDAVSIRGKLIAMGAIADSDPPKLQIVKRREGTHGF